MAEVNRLKSRHGPGHSYAIMIVRAANASLPPGTERKALGEFVLTVMEGAVMQARTYRDIGYFDRNIAVLRDYVTALLAAEKCDNFA